MKLQRSISSFGLLCASVGCMVGSGWLFGAYYAAQITGPAAILSWLLGGGLIIFIALTFSELSSMLPLAGGIARYSHFTHGPMVSFCMSWLAWLSCVAVAPTEVQAILQYGSTYAPGLMHKVGGLPVLTLTGYVVATLLMLVISWCNMMGVKLLTRLNSFMTLWKLLIPIVTIIIIAHVKFSTHNFVSHHFAPHGLHGILWALPTAGIVFSFLGFREATSLAGEAKLPGKGIPLAVIGSVLICTLLYVLVQVVFIGAVPASALVHGGWSHLSFSGDMGPFAGIATSLGLGFLVLLIYVDAQVSPFGTAFIYTATTSRLNYAMSVNRYTPQAMLKLNKKGVPALAIMINFIVGMMLFLPLPTWQALVGFQSTAIVLAYGVGPIALLVLRRDAPNLERPFKLPASRVFCAITFTVCNLIAYWTGWETIWRLMLSIAFGLVFFVIYRAYMRQKCFSAWRSTWWLLPYFGGLTLISYLGNFGGGLGVLSFGWDFLVIALFSVGTLWLACHHSLHVSTLNTLLNDDKEVDYQVEPQTYYEGVKI
ncbi:MAG: amino acid permease [Gammaproteobacteria bacterium CG11_big_fil_rev_8_21_14_0_20_46_22]|nr:MAG: amino acid permease [Gammaproteobacteria bacterium CG12_big_fil_rev_8_21_14_0_65_46_12]PIR11202.1 MAG: amino acid permease [Gammaproteobacteria bacterium CG11_big_fil_rev_8_21_14_0_20_46_22]